MRDRTRQRLLAQAKSRRATREELAEAGKRVKELEQELLSLELLPETKHGEERTQRYSRLLRLRAMREDFQSIRPLEEPNRPNGMLLAVVMTVAAFMLCSACAVGAFAGLQFLHQKPDPMATASGFWYDMENHQYIDLHTNYLSPTLRVQYDVNQFLALANQADQEFGYVTNAVLIKQTGDPTTQVQLTYAVTRSNHVTYDATLTLTLHANTWGVDDLGASVDPTKAGLQAPATPTPAATPTSTPTGSLDGPLARGPVAA
jgi:hypothetical protein